VIAGVAQLDVKIAVAAIGGAVRGTVVAEQALR
jgi:hypothetical protein